MKYCIVIPACNEEQSLGLVLKELTAKVLPKDVLIVNDKSEDTTPQIAKKFKVGLLNNQKRMGYVKSLENGIKHCLKSDVEYVITMDADGEHRVKDLLSIISALKDEQPLLVVTSRNRKNRVVERLIQYWTQKFYGISDPLSGMRAYHKSIVSSGKIESHYSIGTEIILDVVQNKKKYLEIPITVNKRADTPRFGNFFWGNLKELRAFYFIVRHTFHIS